MKFVYQIVGTIVLGLACQALFHLPWWSVALAAGIAALLFDNKAGLSLLAGFLGIAVLWAAAAALVEIETDSILSRQVAALFSPDMGPGLLIAVTAFVGGLAGGLGAVTGTFLRKIREKAA